MQVSFKCSKFKASGLEGYLKLFLPPLTSRCPIQRSQQSLALLGATCEEHITKNSVSNTKYVSYFSVESFYAIIEYICGECPALMLASTEPESQKTTLSLLGLKAMTEATSVEVTPQLKQLMRDDAPTHFHLFWMIPSVQEQNIRC